MAGRSSPGRRRIGRRRSSRSSSSPERRRETADPEARYYVKGTGTEVTCGLCPHRCRIADGRTGVCRVRRNRAGRLETPFYGRLSSVSMDPVEKKPLYHFHPGGSILSIGFVGCSLHCPFCQNHTISQGTSAPTTYHAPDEIVKAARREGSFGIAYTYSEPLIHFEYVMACSTAARSAGLANVLVTNGSINPEPLAELLPVTDAANVDLKSFDASFYHDELGGDLEAVKAFISMAAGRIHLEVTTLIIPGKNDSAAEIEAAARFIASVSPSIPYHLSCYYPRYRYSVPPTPPRTVADLAEVARRHLRFVYLGNVGLEECNTVCPECGAVLIRRSGYRTDVVGVAGGACAKCGFDPGIPGLPQA